MSILCGLPLLECVYCLACARWAWKRCLHTAGHDSETWGLASAEEIEPIPRLCRYILAVYEDDLRHPLWEPPAGYGIDPDWLILKRTYKDTHGQHADIVLAIRGLNMAKESDYAVLLDNKLGQRKFDGGYVHNGLLKAAGWVLDAECETLKELVEKYPNYTLTFAGHSLGSGVAASLTMVVVQNRDKLGNIDRKKIRCYAIAPARCMSLNLAVRYADVINSVVLQERMHRISICRSPYTGSWWDFLINNVMLADIARIGRVLCTGCYQNSTQNQHIVRNLNLPDCVVFADEMLRNAMADYSDDFLPRTATPLEDIFKSLFCNSPRPGIKQNPMASGVGMGREANPAQDIDQGLGKKLLHHHFDLPCLLCLRCMRDTCIPEQKMLKDPRRLYAPGRLYHIVERKPFRCGRFPPVVRTAVPVDGRFEHIVLSCNATSDHGIIWIEREAQRALNLLHEKNNIMEIPAKQKMERQETLAREHSEEYKAALQRAVTLNVPHAYSPSPYGTFNDQEEGEDSHKSSSDTSTGSSKRSKKRESWNELIEHLFDKDESGHIVLEKSHKG
ncbi:unnamed protein product [Ilex paraguariensis]|uniref:Calmodulin-binding heat-shock protein n=1 Tax=Ilex paraguariensis TaxID=185542 RepID=A0ABC8UVD3_9AQUA